jgi:hypothetical protein
LRSYTSSPTEVSPAEKSRLRMSTTSFDSELCGRKEAVSSWVASWSLPPSGLSAKTAITHATSTTHLLRRPVTKFANALMPG